MIIDRGFEEIAIEDVGIKRNGYPRQVWNLAELDCGKAGDWSICKILTQDDKPQQNRFYVDGH